MCHIMKYLYLITALIIDIENPKQESEEIVRSTITELGDNLWEYTYEATTNNKSRYIEKTTILSK